MEVTRYGDVESSTAGIRKVLLTQLDRLLKGQVSTQQAAVTAKMCVAALQSAQLELAHAKHFPAAAVADPPPRSITFSA